MDVQTIKASPRTVTGKKVKRLRSQGITPVHLYGTGTEALTLQADSQVLRRILPRLGANIPVSVEVEGKPGENLCFVREVQRHPVTEEVLHVDFLRVDISRSVQAEVPVVLTGTAPAVRQLNGTLFQSLQTVMVESLPMNVPASIEADVSGLDTFDKGIHVRDLETPSNVTVVTDPDELVARVSAPVAEVEEEAAEAEEAAAVEEAAEGEEQAEEEA